MKKKVLALILAMSMVIGMVACNKSTPTDAEVEPATSVSTTPVKQGTITSTMNFDGNLEAESEIIVTVATPGKVISSNVEVGSTVKKGDLLFSMDSKDVAVQKGATQAQYDAAKASASYAGGMLSDAKAQLSSAKDSKAKLEKQMDSMAAPINQALAGSPIQKSVAADFKAKKYSAALAKIKASKVDNPLFTALEQLVESQGQLTASIPQLESSIKSIEGQKIQADGQVNVAKAGLKAIDAQISNFKVYAPIAGVIGTYNIQVGSYPTAQIPLTIVNMDSVKLTVGMLDTQIGNTKAGDLVDVDIEALGETAKGKVTAVAPSPDMQSKLYPVSIEIENPGHRIKPGFFVKAAFPVSQKDSTLYVPVAGIQKNDDGSSYVYINENNIARKKNVTTGIEDRNGNIEVSAGVALGDLVITTNLTMLRDGAPVFSLQEKEGEN